MTEPTLAGALDGCRRWRDDGSGTNPFRLRCALLPPASAAEVAAAWPAGVHPEAVELWSLTARARLFEDADYGQWGLVLLDPAEAARRTAEQRAARPAQWRPDDVVIGEFLGDLELVVLAASEAGGRRVLIARPLDDRAEWPAAGGGLAAFVHGLLVHGGDKYWEVAERP